MDAQQPERHSADEAATACVFGPVPSRRLGQSLGIDPILFKTCNFSCVYCQLGRTTRLTLERADFVPRERIRDEVARALAAPRALPIDHVTFAGQGEPTLCASLGWLLREVRALSPLPVAVLTNAALIDRADVRDELAAADVVIPTLDAAEQALFARLNRPHGRLHVEQIIAGLAAFRRQFRGQLWVEVMLVAGVNDDAAALQGLREALARIAPDQVHLNTPVRPPAEPWVAVPDDETLARAAQILGQAAQVIAPREDALALGAAAAADAATAVLAIVRRHPLREARLLEYLARFGEAESRRVLDELERSGELRRLSHRGEVFWEHAAGAFADGERERR